MCGTIIASHDKSSGTQAYEILLYTLLPLNPAINSVVKEFERQTWAWSRMSSVRLIASEKEISASISELANKLDATTRGTPSTSVRLTIAKDRHDVANQCRKVLLGSPTPTLASNKEDVGSLLDLLVHCIVCQSVSRKKLSNSISISRRTKRIRSKAPAGNS
jgi:hypothetical protein